MAASTVRLRAVDLQDLDVLAYELGRGRLVVILGLGANTVDSIAV